MAIKIKESRKGTFTAAAKKRGKVYLNLLIR